MPGHDDICVVVTDQSELWLLNSGSAKASLGPAELFGFNTGGFCYKPTGLVTGFASRFNLATFYVRVPYLYVSSPCAGQAMQNTARAIPFAISHDATCL